MMRTSYQRAEVDKFKVFYREAGRQGAPKLLLLHRFPTSSHMFRNLIPLLTDQLHVVATHAPEIARQIREFMH